VLHHYICSKTTEIRKILERTKYFKEKLKVLFPADTQQTERAEIIICLTSLVLNIRLAERMQQLQDNDMKYRYLLMKGKADGKSLDLLEMNFNRKRDNVFIQSVTDTVIDFEYRSRLSSSGSTLSALCKARISLQSSFTKAFPKSTK